MIMRGNPMSRRVTLPKRGSPAMRGTRNSRPYKHSFEGEIILASNRTPLVTLPKRGSPAMRGTRNYRPCKRSFDGEISNRTPISNAPPLFTSTPLSSRMSSPANAPPQFTSTPVSSRMSPPAFSFLDCKPRSSGLSSELYSGPSTSQSSGHIETVDLLSDEEKDDKKLTSQELSAHLPCITIIKLDEEVRKFLLII